MPETETVLTWEIVLRTYGDPQQLREEQKSRLKRMLRLAWGDGAFEIHPAKVFDSQRAERLRLAERVDELEHACREQMRYGACQAVVDAIGLNNVNGAK